MFGGEASVVIALIGIISAFVIAGLYIGERLVYYCIARKEKRRNRAIEDLDKMLSDFRVLAERVVSGKEKKEWLQVKAQGKVIKHRERRTNDLLIGQMAFDDLSKRMSKKFDESREWEFKIMENQLNHYFVNLYDLIERIEKDKNLDKQDKIFYIDRVRRSLSTHEILTLFYFCMGENDFCRQLKCWVKKYYLFEAWPFYLFDTEWSHIKYLKCYGPSAFGKRGKFLSQLNGATPNHKEDI